MSGMESKSCGSLEGKIASRWNAQGMLYKRQNLSYALKNGQDLDKQNKEGLRRIITEVKCKGRV